MPQYGKGNAKSKQIEILILVDENQGSEVERSVQQAEELASATEWEYQALTSKEEEDLNKLMKEVKFVLW